MPRDGSGVASAVPGSDTVAPNTTILSALHNSMVQDIYQLFNTAWPVAYGGSGAISASNFADLNNSTSILSLLLKDIGGAVTAGGTATAITATLNRAYTAYGASAGQIANGTMLSLKMPLAATGAATLTLSAPSALAGKAIRRQGDTAISANDWLANATIKLRYDTAYNAAAGAWVLLNADATGGFLPISGGTLTGLLTTNGQVGFPVAQNPSSNANTLDDYKEATTYSATIGNNTGSYSSISLSSQRLVKVGRETVISGKITCTTIGTANGVLTLSSGTWPGADTNAVGIATNGNTGAIGVCRFSSASQLDIYLSGFAHIFTASGQAVDFSIAYYANT